MSTSEAGSDSHGSLDSAVWDSLAFKAAITPDMQLQGVNDQKYTPAGSARCLLASTSHAIGLSAFLLYAWRKKW